MSRPQILILSWKGSPPLGVPIFPVTGARALGVVLTPFFPSLPTPHCLRLQNHLEMGHFSPFIATNLVRVTTISHLDSLNSF